jgi:hypothetical protein
MNWSATYTHPSEGEWFPVVGAPEYFVSPDGRVWSSYSHKVLKPSVSRKGYLVVHLRRKRRQIHRIVAETLIGPCPSGQQVRHLDGNPANCDVSNLEYGTPSENVLDTVRHGRHPWKSLTHCMQGHPFDEANTGSRVDRPTSRVCKTCMREWRRQYRIRKAAA